jgi:hypothetical protein
MVGFIPFLTLSEHRIQDGQQLAHTGFGFSCCNQKCVKRGLKRVATSTAIYNEVRTPARPTKTLP